MHIVITKLYSLLFIVQKNFYCMSISEGTGVPSLRKHEEGEVQNILSFWRRATLMQQNAYPSNKRRSTHHMIMLKTNNFHFLRIRSVHLLFRQFCSFQLDENLYPRNATCLIKMSNNKRLQFHYYDDFLFCRGSIFTDLSCISNGCLLILAIPYVFLKSSQNLQWLMIILGFRSVHKST